MPSPNFSTSEINRAVELKQQALYRKDGYQKARYLRRNLTDYENHLFAFLIDLNICLMPVYIWAIEFLLILTGLIPPGFFDLLFYLMYALLFLCSCVVMPLKMAAGKGQTWGMKIVGIKLVDSSLHEASAMKLVLRELLGFGVPIMLFGYFFSIWGLLIWWAVSIVVVLVSPHQQTIFDWVFSLVPVYVPEYQIRVGKPASQIASENEQAPEEPAAEPEPEASPEEPEPETPAALSPIDLHIRSSYSDDSTIDVEDIFQQAKAQNMEVISITDHNCARANAQAQRFASMYGIQYIPGMEADCEYNGQRVRILGYYIDWNDPVFDAIEKNSLRREKEASLERARLFEKYMNIRIDLDSILSRSRFQTITPKDLTSMVFRNEKTRQLPKVQDVLKRCQMDEKEARKLFEKEVFGKDGPCHVTKEYPDAIKFIEDIHKAGGMAVLSGWHADELKDETLEGLLDAGLDGLEVFTPDVDARTAAFLLSIASQEKLFVTAGSDYHGKNKPDRQLGRTGCPAKGLNTVRVFTRALDRPESENTAAAGRNRQEPQKTETEN